MEQVRRLSLQYGYGWTDGARTRAQRVAIGPGALTFIGGQSYSADQLLFHISATEFWVGDSPRVPLAEATDARIRDMALQFLPR